MDRTSTFNFMNSTLVRFAERYKWRLIISVFLIGFSLLLVLEPGFWIFDALDSMRIYYAILLTILTIFFFLRGKSMLAGSAAIALAVLSPGIWKYFRPAEDSLPNAVFLHQETSAPDFTVAHFNVKENNKNIFSVAKGAVESDADIISLQELHETSLNKIDTILRRKYPYAISDVSIPGFGMAVYSKYPMHERKIIKDSSFPLLTGVVSIHDRDIHFISATTSTPTDQKGFEEQQKQLNIISAYVNAVDSPLVVMGDMNSVPWSEGIKDLLKKTKLEDSRKNLAATFPANSIFQVPIDYIFHSPALKCLTFGTLEATSSNHLGIIGSYAWDNIGSKNNSAR